MKSFNICSLPSKDFVYLIEKGIECLIVKVCWFVFFFFLFNYILKGFFWLVFIYYNLGIHPTKVHKLLYISVENALWLSSW